MECDNGFPSDMVQKRFYLEELQPGRRWRFGTLCVEIMVRQIEQKDPLVLHQKRIKESPERIWVCPKCGFNRSNKATHIHGKDIDYGRNRKSG